MDVLINHFLRNTAPEISKVTTNLLGIMFDHLIVQTDTPSLMGKVKLNPVYDFKAIHDIICVNFEYSGKMHVLINYTSYLYTVNNNALFDHVTKISNFNQ